MWVPSHISIVKNEIVAKYADCVTKSITNLTINISSVNYIKIPIHKIFLQSAYTAENEYQLQRNLKTKNDY